MSKVFLGIDPGSKGFLTLINGNNIEYWAIPTIKNKVDYQELSKIFYNLFMKYEDNIHVVLEDVHSIFGASSKSTFSFGHIQGFIEGCLSSFQLPYTKVQPKKWQKLAWEGIPLIKKPSTSGKTQVTDTKAMSLMAAKRLFPKEDLRATERSKVPHDGKIDSLLIAYYAKCNFK